MRLEHHLVGGYVRYISPHIIIIIMPSWRLSIIDIIDTINIHNDISSHILLSHLREAQLSDPKGMCYSDQYRLKLLGNDRRSVHVCGEKQQLTFTVNFLKMIIALALAVASSVVDWKQKCTLKGFIVGTDWNMLAYMYVQTVNDSLSDTCK